MAQFITQIFNGLSVGCIYALIAVGYTMVYGIIKLINFAHGEFYMFGAYVGYFTLVLMFGGTPNGRDQGTLALLATLLLSGLATGVLAVLVERLVYRPLRRAGRIVALLAALGVSLLMQNAGQQQVGAEVRAFPHMFTSQRLPREKIDPAALRAGEVAARDMAVLYTVPVEGGEKTRVENLAQRGHAVEASAVKRLAQIVTETENSRGRVSVYAYPAITVTSKDGLVLVVLGIISLLLYIIVQHTRVGRAMRAVSHDFEAAALMGVDINRVIAFTFFIGAFVAGVGGTLGGGMYYSSISPLMGLMPGLKAFVAAVVGGIGSIPGAIVGALTLGICESMVTGYVNALYTDAFTFGLLIVMLLVRPSGILGKPLSDKL